MANFEETYEGLEDLIVRDQYFLTCPKELQTFLKEQGKLDLKQIKGTNASVTNKFISNESKRPMRCFVCDKVVTKVWIAGQEHSPILS